MLSDSNLHTDIAVKDIENAREFYGSTLGLKEIKRDKRGDTFYKSGDSYIKIYQSSSAGTNQATYMSWQVGDVGSIVTDLKSKGVMFEQYDIPGVTRNGDIHVMGDEQAAWFKDPDGNILCVSNDNF